jgi:hypothetical protein
MVKEFPCHIAWTEVIKEGYKFVGLIEYQRRAPCSMVHELYVVGPHVNDETDAELAAAAMLENIREITDYGDVIFSDGVML